MSIFQSQMISQILFGEGASMAIGQTLQKMNISKALIITDEFISKAGLTKGAEAGMQSAGIEVDVFTGAEPENPTDIIESVAAMIKEKQYQAIISIGGGSAMDLAKSVRILLANPGTIQDYFDMTKPRQMCMAPLILVPTTAGTSSEISHGLMMFDRENNRKTGLSGPDLAATIAVVDPALCKSLPARITAVTGFDCLCHAAEALTCKVNENAITNMMGMDAIRLVAENLEKAVADGSDMEARTNMSLACLYAGIAFNNCPPHMAHSIGHTSGAMCHIAHGEACGSVLPMVMEISAAAKPERVKMVGEAMGVNFTADDTPEVIGKKTADRIRDLYTAVGLKQLKELIKEDDIAPIAAGAMKDAGTFIWPVALDAAQLEEQLRKEFER